MTHWSERYITFLRSVVPEIAATPLYVLRVDESAVEWQTHWMATFSPLADLRAQQTLQRLGLWAGRGICILVRDDFASWSDRCKFGTLLHELSHALEYLSQPDALVTAAELSPVARELLNGSESKILQTAGICQNNLARIQHGADFVRYAMHLYTRARQHIALSPGDIQFLHENYSLPSAKYDAVMTALSSELVRTHNLDLTRLREPPALFMELFR